MRWCMMSDIVQLLLCYVGIFRVLVYVIIFRLYAMLYKQVTIKSHNDVTLGLATSASSGPTFSVPFLRVQALQLVLFNTLIELVCEG